MSEVVAAFAATACGAFAAGIFTTVGVHIAFPEALPKPTSEMLPVGTVAYAGPFSKGGWQVCVEPFDETVPANDMAGGQRGVCQVFDVRTVGQCESWWDRTRGPEPHKPPNEDSWQMRWPECIKRGTSR